MDITIKLLLCTLIFWTQTSVSQDLFKEKIWKIPSRKRSAYFDEGIFYVGSKRKGASVVATRHFYARNKGYERIVFDLNSNLIPRIYGYIGKSEKKLYIDFFNTSVSKSVSSVGQSKFVKSLYFFPISDRLLSLEMEFKSKLSFDIFYLNDPGRLVIDVKP